MQAPDEPGLVQLYSALCHHSINLRTRSFPQIVHRGEQGKGVHLGRLMRPLALHSAQKGLYLFHLGDAILFGVQCAEFLLSQLVPLLRCQSP